MNKSSKVSSVQANGTWDGKFGTMYKHEVTFENGDCGEYSSKVQEQTKFVVGQESEYIFTDGQYPKVKPVFVQQAGGGSSWKGNSDNPERQLMIVKQSSLKCAVELSIERKRLKTEDVLQLAQELCDWVMIGKKEEEFIPAPKQSEPAQAFSKPVQKVESLQATAQKDDLPF
jgi:hypothetical protein